jgi:hypothetical protein
MFNGGVVAGVSQRICVDAKTVLLLAHFTTIGW